MCRGSEIGHAAPSERPDYLAYSPILQRVHTHSALHTESTWHRQHHCLHPASLAVERQSRARNQNRSGTTAVNTAELPFKSIWYTVYFGCPLILQSIRFLTAENRRIFCQSTFQTFIVFISRLWDCGSPIVWPHPISRDCCGCESAERELCCDLSTTSDEKRLVKTLSLAQHCDPGLAAEYVNLY
jgi:hypothetical protein